MSITNKDEKILWGRAAGICSNPDCRDDLTELVENGIYTIGEMAHIIGKKETARRSIKGGGSDSYYNLILLCPTCHTHVDKAPEGTYPESLLHAWKNEVEALRTKNLGLIISNYHYDLFEYAYSAFSFEKNAIFIRSDIFVFNNSYYNSMFQMLNRIKHYSNHIVECRDNHEIDSLIKEMYQLLKDFDGEEPIINMLCHKSRLLTDYINRTFNSGVYRGVINFARCLNAWLVSKAYGKEVDVSSENLKNSLSVLLRGKIDDIFLDIAFKKIVHPDAQERMLYERSVYLIQNLS